MEASKATNSWSLSDLYVAGHSASVPHGHGDLLHMQVFKTKLGFSAAESVSTARAYEKQAWTAQPRRSEDLQTGIWCWELQYLCGKQRTEVFDMDCTLLQRPTSGRMASTYRYALQ